MIRLISLGVCILICLAGFKFGIPQKAEPYSQKTVLNRIGTHSSPELVDGLHVFLCGTNAVSSGFRRKSPCVGVLAGERVFIFNAGANSIHSLESMGFPVDRIETIFLTHLHSDRIDGLGNTLMQIWISGKRKIPITVMGPTGTSDVVYGFNAAYRLDSKYRTAHHGEVIANPVGYGGDPNEIIMTGKTKLVLDEGDMKITAFTVSHDPMSPAYGYRVDYKDRSIALTGDTFYEPKMARFVDGVDVLFHEVLNTDMIGAVKSTARQNKSQLLTKTLSEITASHTTPAQAAKIAAAAEVKELILHHIGPTLSNKTMSPIFLQGTSTVFDGKITVAQDKMTVHLPAYNSTITQRNSLW